MKNAINKKWLVSDAQFILLALLTTIVFYTGITPSFSSDDYVHLLNNTKFTNLNEALVVFTEPFGREYRPLVRLSLWINHLMGDTAIPFKITNLFLHLLTTLFIYRILNKLQFSKLASILGTTIFALHPIHVTSIHFILGRTDLIAAVFYFGTLALVVEWKNTITIKEYITVSVVFAAALLSKEMSITLSLMMFAIVFYNQKIKNINSFVNVLKKLSPFFALTLAYIIVRIFMWSKLVDDVAEYTNYSISHVINNYLSWFFALIYPFDLYFAQELMVKNPIGFFLVAAICVFTILTTLLIFSHRKLFEICKSFWLKAALIWIAVTLLPICGGNPHRWYLYIPSFGLSILIAATIENAEQNRKKIVLILVGILLTVYSIEIFRLSNIWQKQSKLNIEFLKQIETNKIYEKELIYFANVPFGYKSAYLFTHNSLQEAIQYYFNRSPKIVAISYVNIGDELRISSYIDNGTINFKMDPDHYNFFLLSANERRFDSLGVARKESALVQINTIAENKKISDYSIAIPEKNWPDFYYFDGKNIKAVNGIGL